MQTRDAWNEGQPGDVLEWVESVMETPITVEAGSL